MLIMISSNTRGIKKFYHSQWMCTCCILKLRSVRRFLSRSVQFYIQISNLINTIVIKLWIFIQNQGFTCFYMCNNLTNDLFSIFYIFYIFNILYILYILYFIYFIYFIYLIFYIFYIFYIFNILYISTYCVCVHSVLFLIFKFRINAQKSAV